MQIRNVQVTVLIILLFVVGFTTIAYRHWVLGVSFSEPKTAKQWIIEANIKFTARRGPRKVMLTIPHQPTGWRIVDENFISPNYGITTHVENDNRIVTWTKRNTHGRQALYYRVTVIKDATEVHEPATDATTAESTELLSDAQKSAVQSLFKKAQEQSTDRESLAKNLLQTLQNRQDEAANLLVGDNQGIDNITRQAINILQTHRIPAQLLKGFYLKSYSNLQFDYYLGIASNHDWLFINPKTLQIGIPKGFLPWQHGDLPLAMMNDTTPVKVEFSAQETYLTPYHQSISKVAPFNLPLSVQKTYKILLTLPLGALLILLLRNYIGLRSMGTFMPILIALAFRETQLLWGIVWFVSAVMLGLLVRFYLENLRLSVVPRLSAVLTTTVLYLLMVSLISHRLQLQFGLYVSLFPIVIITMTIERLCVMWDESGPLEVLKLSLTSLFAAALFFQISTIKAIEYFVFAFPEAQCVILATILLLGRYHGYRLMELVRFRAMVKPYVTPH